MKKRFILLFFFLFALITINAQETCTPHDHPSNEVRNKGFMDGTGQILANDFVISANTLSFLVEQIEANLWTEEGEIETMDVILHSDDNGNPGDVIGEISGITPTSQDIIDMDELDGFEIRSVKLDLPSELTLEGSGVAPVKYWLQLVAYPSIPGKRIGWEFNGVEVYDEGVKYSNTSIDYWMTNENWDGVFSIQGICTTTEGCHIPEAVNVIEIEPNEATVVWVGNEEAEQYILEYGLHGFEPNTGEGTILEVNGDNTSITLTDLDLVTQYDVYLKSICADGESIHTVPHTFTTIDFYCTIGNLAIIEPITYVEFAGIENSSDTELDNSPAHEYFLDVQAEVIPGETYPIVVEGNTGGNYQDGVTVFFDWNQDGEFNNTSERYDVGVLFNSNGEDDQQISTEILVPENALTGVTRMRVVKEFYAGEYPTDGCYWISYGQAEDYTVAVGVVGLSEINENAVTVYPNPVSDVLNISSETTISSVKVYNLTGQLIMETKLNTTERELNVSNLSSGIYIIKLEVDNSSVNYKIIKR